MCYKYFSKYHYIHFSIKITHRIKKALVEHCMNGKNGISPSLVSFMVYIWYAERSFSIIDDCIHTLSTPSWESRREIIAVVEIVYDSK